MLCGAFPLTENSNVSTLCMFYEGTIASKENVLYERQSCEQLALRPTIRLRLRVLLAISGGVRIRCCTR
jgi:hypothetical protein